MEGNIKIDVKEIWKHVWTDYFHMAQNKSQ